MSSNDNSKTEYSAPHLTYFGEVSTLTAGGSMNTPETVASPGSGMLK